MTLHDIEQSTAAVLTVDEVAAFLGVDAGGIRYMARTNPALLGFPVMAYKHSDEGTRFTTKIPREGFLNWYKGKGAIQ